MKKSDICIVRAKLKQDYVYDAIEKCGYKICIPYRDKNIIFRIIRELWFKLKIPQKTIWYNKEVKNKNAKVFIIYDPLIVPDYILWIKKYHPEARIILNYENRVDTTINPNAIKCDVEKWTYDEDDAYVYSMNLLHPSYFDIYKFNSEKYEKKYDILYLGRDKGRLDEILYYKEKFEKKNLKTYFYICADRAYLQYKNRIYKPVLPYSKYLLILKRSKAILNIVRKDQRSVTQRELEAVFDNVKCITTNQAIMQFELYDKSRYFILGMDDINEIHHFLESKFKKVDENILQKYRFETVMEELINGKTGR